MLTLHPPKPNDDDLPIASTPLRYDVLGLPQGDTAVIAFHVDRWRVQRTRGGVVGEWSGSFESPEAALATFTPA